MKMRWIAGAALLVLAACEQSLTRPEVAAPQLERREQPPGWVRRDTTHLNNGYFGSGHGREQPDTMVIIE